MDFDQLGPYKIGPRLGKGGMGSVYRGENVDTHEVAAIKALAPQLASSEGFRERFEAEIESLKTLKHDGIVRLYGYGEEDGTVFYAMELVDGRSLEEELKAGRRFTWREVVDIAIQVCKALKHAHDHGIVHRDIKPANILLDNDDRVKLADFGIARLFGGSQLTMAGGVLGTADYMSPEQADGRPVTDRCDQYSLGCVMYALLAGRPPFRAKTLPEMLQMQRYAEPEPVRRYAPEAPEQLEDCIAQLLKKDPAERFPNTVVLARHLEAMRRALSRPFDASKTMPGDELEPSVEQVPLEVAATQPGTSAADPSESAHSIDLDVVPTVIRDAETVDSLIEGSSSLEQPKPAVSRSFTTVDSTRGTGKSALNPSMLLVAGALVALVASAGYGLYRMSRPYTAQQLYDRVHSASDSPSVDELRSHEAEIDEFVSLHATDPRAEQMRTYQTTLKLDRLQRRFDAMVRGREESRGLLTAERLYLEAASLEGLDPQAAAERYRHIEQLFGMVQLDESLDADERDRITDVVELARYQRDRMQARANDQRESDLAALDRQLAIARARLDSHSQQAREICEAIVEVYGEEPWASDRVEKARQLLRRLAGGQVELDAPKE